MNFARLTIEVDRIKNLDEVEDMTEHTVWARLRDRYFLIDNVHMDGEGDIIIELEDEGY